MKSILVVDDEYTNVQALHLILEGQGYFMLEAWNGIEGLATLKREHIDLIISDIMMPIMDGLEMCRIIQKEAEKPVPPIILMSATTPPKPESGVVYDHFLSKPFTLLELISAVQSAIGLPNVE